ncbi:hypothetical protein KY333_03305 [Candidatus Woesearchaeota archaeon]|nr:hypothetical protein [Candidatus Woesearchaeota archaeon]MBW2993968.1 hypothetical protein [Candidatus Woesearchaeota archaeon]
MKAMIFDAGPIISLTTNNLLWTLEPLKAKFGGEFYITEGVRKELVEKPLTTKKFKFEALQVQHQIEKGVLKVIKNPEVTKKAKQMLDLANNVFYIRKHPLQTLQLGELEALAAAKLMKIPYIVVDERMTRLLLENPGQMEQLLERRLHADVHVKRDKLVKLHKEVEGVKLIRSLELAAIAYEHNILDDYLVKIPEARKQLLQAILWGIKLNGCSAGQNEIDAVVKIMLKKK